MFKVFWRVTSLALAFPVIVIYTICQSGIINIVIGEYLSKAIFLFCAISLFVGLQSQRWHSYLIIIPITYIFIALLDIITKSINIDYLYIIAWILSGVLILNLDGRLVSAK